MSSRSNGVTNVRLTQIDDLVGEPVALVLELLHLASDAVAPFGKGLEQVDDRLGDRDGVLRRPVVEVEELAFLRYEADAGHGHQLFTTVSPSDAVGTLPYRWGSIPRFSRCIEGLSRRVSPARRSSSARRCFDYYGVPWLYEPRTFVLEAGEDGRVLEAFTPDFYLPDQDLYVELTVMKQSLVTRKNRKLRKLRERYPDVKVKLFYKRDLERLAQHFHLDLAS